MSIWSTTLPVPSAPRFRTGQPLIFRLIALGLRRDLLDTASSSSISSSTLSWNAGLSRGGERRETRHFSADNPYGMHERYSIGVHPALESRLMHEPPKGEMGHHQAVELLPDQIGRLASQGDLPAAQMGFQFIKGGLDFPPLMVEGGELLGRGKALALRAGSNDQRIVPIAEVLPEAIEKAQYSSLRSSSLV